MFDIKDIMKKVDMDSIKDLAKKAGLKDSQVSKLTDHAADAVKYRVNKEKARGNEKKVANLLSENENTEDCNKMASKMEGDFVYNLTNKMGLPKNIADKLSSGVMKNMLGGITKNLSSMNVNNLDGIMDKFGDNDMVDGFKKKFSKLF